MIARCIILLIFLFVLSLTQAMAQLGGNPLGAGEGSHPPGRDTALGGNPQTVRVDSLELMRKVAIAQLETQLEAEYQAMKAAYAFEQQQTDSLRIVANQLALKANYQVRRVNRAEEQLIDRHFELQKIEKKVDRHLGWLSRMDRKRTFVRYKTFYPDKRDKRAKGAHIIGNLLFLLRTGYEFTRH